DRIEVLKLLQDAVSPDSRLPGPQRVTLLERAVTIDPVNATIYYHLGEAYAQSGRPAEAAKLYRQGVRNGVRTAWLYSRLGNLSLRQGNKSEAIAFFERAAQLNPTDSESLSDLGMAYLETGKLAEAERVFKWAVQAGGEYALAYNGL